MKLSMYPISMASIVILWYFTGGKEELTKIWLREPNHKRIFFLETSGYGNVSLRFLTSVESAAYWNPDKSVILYLFSNQSQQLTPPMAGLQSVYSNVHYETYTLEEFARYTLLQEWFQEGKWKTSEFRNAHITDGFRFLELWRSGGLYMDLDILTLKRLDLPMNTVTWESGDYIASGFLAFQKGHPVMLAALNMFVDYYNPDVYFVNGPPVVTSVYKRYKEALGEKCDVALLPVSTVGPTEWVEGKNYFDEKMRLATVEKAKDSMAAHWWNDLAKSTKIEANSGCAFMDLIKNNCPFVYKEIQTQGWV